MKKMFVSFATLAWGVAVALGAVGAESARAADADAYPSKPVTMVVPSAAGGGSDLIARLYSDELGKYFKQAFIIDNKPGANGIIGVD